MKTRQIRSAAEFETYIRGVEEWIAGDDPASKLDRKLERKAKKHGLTSLSPAERTFLALDAFNSAVMNDQLDNYFNTLPAAFLDSAEAGFKKLYDAATARRFRELRTQVAQGSTPTDDEVFVFLDNYFDLSDRLDQYCEAEGLY